QAEAAAADGRGRRRRVTAARAAGDQQSDEGEQEGRSGSCQPHPGYDAVMAVTTRPKLDAHRLRADFPIFEQRIHGKPLAYLDSANSSQKPRHVLDAMTTFYETSYANVHRAVYELAERATEALEGSREKVRAFVNA